jgi:hypothetical protein
VRGGALFNGKEGRGDFRKNPQWKIEILNGELKNPQWRIEIPFNGK